jgi:hypothetical protein
MAIDVVCTGCRSRFQVSDKFAGQKGPCPKCKAIIIIPSKKDEIVIHAPEVSGPKDAAGRSVLQPIFREEPKISTPLIVVISATVFVVLLSALFLRIMFHGKDVPVPLLIAGAIALAPALTLGGYTFLRDDELQPYRGPALFVRLIPCSIVYPLLWGVYWLIFAYLGIQPEIIHMLFVAPAAIALGALCAQASLDLEFGSAALHYSLYLVCTILLRLLMGMNGMWNVT